MKNAVICIALLFACASAARAGSEGGGRDPFFPEQARATPPAPAAPAGGGNWGRDPFANPLGGVRQQGVAVPARQGGGGGLSGIIYNKQTRLAIVAGEVLREGNMIGDRKIIDIRRRSIVVMTPAGGLEEMLLEDFSLGR